MRYVKYNRDEELRYPEGEEPEDQYLLTPGRIFEVTMEYDYMGRKWYSFFGVHGNFPAELFDDFTVYLAYAKNKPVKGKGAHLLRLNPENNYLTQKVFITTKVQVIEEIGVDTYMIVTFNSVYIVKML